jgi:hypothetical protein
MAGVEIMSALAEEDPPGAEHGTCEDEDCPHDDDDNERLPYRGIKSAQGSSRPIHPGCAVAIR